LPIGAHMSIAGGLERALQRGKELGCQAVQIFTRNQIRWDSDPLGEEEIRRFRAARKETGLGYLLAHASYLINLAAGDPALRRRSIGALQEELSRAEKLGISHLVLHPGSHGGSGEKTGLLRVSRALDSVLKGEDAGRITILLETTAGQGTSLGYRFEHLACIRDNCRSAERIGFCFDTCHVFAAGYELRSAAAYQETMGRFLELVGREKVKAFHLNDSRSGKGSRIDRHQHIGRGALGLLPFYLLLHDRRFGKLPMILETPKGREGGQDLDQINLRILWRLRAEKDPPARGSEGGQ
jgi:deoxyribonuclease-4